ncbi:unnamed protein product [Prorocentrum cordatum]|uniref:Palmitoyltransferase n=1 Tax=Prorocentrum cordatum TaxID=2364126 RepID=A0ABN9XBC7_9DINO|nr:unnamed protein product [Polarella glacialis]
MPGRPVPAQPSGHSAQAHETPTSGTATPRSQGANSAAGSEARGRATETAQSTPDVQTSRLHGCRYLDYAEPLLRLDGAPEKTLATWSPLLPRCAPEPRFGAYLTGDFRGGSTVCAGGRLAAGQLCARTVNTALFTLLPGIYYWSRVLPLAGDCGAIRGTQALLSVLIVVSFTLAAFMNPGIVPRSERIPDGVPLDPRTGMPNQRFLLIHDVTVRQKFCTTCMVYRPPRAKHCAFCDNCVLRFDHHCTWLGNCVGLYNYRSFLLLLSSVLRSS